MSMRRRSLAARTGSFYERLRQRRASSVARLHFSNRRRGVHRVLRTGPPAPARPRRRIQVLGVTGVVLLSVMVVRLWYLQVLDSKSFTSTVASEAYQVDQVPAPRGVIETRTGVPLVTNQAEEEITLSRADAQQYPQVVGAVAALVGRSAAAVDAALANPQYTSYQQIPVARHATVAEITTLAQHPGQFPGVKSQTVSVVGYPFGTVASHVLGYVTPITQAELKQYAKDGYQPGSPFGQSGLEAQYQQQLAGTPGKDLVEVNAQGNTLGVVKRTAPVAGDTVVTNIDLPLQQQLDADLAAEIAKLRAKGMPAPGGSAVIMDPNNGHVLAMASYPTYDPVVWDGGISEANYQALTSPQSHEPLINRAIAGAYTPGSVFKLATATAALDDGLITTSYIYNDATGTYTVPGCTAGKCTYHNAGYQALGRINITPAIAASDDSFFYNLGVMFWEQRAKYGEDAIQKWANAYSYGEGTGIDLPGEQTGFVDSPQVEQKLHQQYPKAYPYPQWYAGNNLEMAFGQGATLLTPIEVADAYSTFANGGTKYQPQVAAAFVSPTGKLIKRIAPKVTGHVTVTPQDHAAMLAGFEGAVGSSIGTAYYTFQGFPLSSYPIAGKTGTASVDSPSGQRLAPNSWFVGWNPPSHPQYLIAGEISRAGYGAAGFAYVARDIFTYLMNHHNQINPETIPGVPGNAGLAPTGPAAQPSPAGPIATAATAAAVTSPAPASTTPAARATRAASVREGVTCGHRVASCLASTNLPLVQLQAAVFDGAGGGADRPRPPPHRTG
jgi:penicillin-binding protein 2